MTARCWTTAYSDSLRTPLVRALLFVALYVGGAELGHFLSFQGQFATFWPPSGVFLAALLMTATPRWPAVLLLALISNLISDCGLHGQLVPVSVGFWFANSVEAMIGAWLFRRFVSVTPTFESLREVLGLILISAVVSANIGATLGAVVVSQAYGAHWGSAWLLWRTSDMVGLILFAPLFMTVAAPRRPCSIPCDARRILEFSLAFSSLIVFTFLVNGPIPRSYGFLVFPILIWIALRFEVPGICLANVLRSIVSLWSIQQGYGPFANGSPLPNQVQFLQSFLTISSASLLLLAAVVMERRRAARVLEQSESRYRNLLDNMNDLVHSLDADGRLLYTNRAWRETLGYSVQEVESLNISQVIHPDDLAVYQFKLARLAQGEKRTCVELRFRTKSGQTLVVEGSSSCHLVDGKPFATCSIYRDITSRHEHELQLDQYRRQLEEANYQLQLLATTDGMTGLQNRRAFQGRLEEEVERSQRYHHHVSLLLLDVDHFKQFNDTFGHPAGDEALKRVSRILEENARLSDYVARYGGEEFAIILPNTDEAGSMIFAERLRLAIAEEPWTERRITVSVGVATLIPDCFLNLQDLDGSSLIQAADEALYHSKRHGRNQSCHASDCADAMTNYEVQVSN